MNDGEARKKILEAVFRRRGRNGVYTRLFDDMTVDQQRALREYAELSNDELPIAGSVESPDQWLILTTRRLVWSQGESVRVIEVSKIIDTVADFRELQRLGRGKAEMQELQVKTKAGMHAIAVEPGAPLSGMWSVLKSIGRHNRAS